MNTTRKERQALYREQHHMASGWPSVLTPVPEYEWPHVPNAPVKVWRSKKYLVQMYEEQSTLHKNLKRLSIQRSTLAKDGGWMDGLTWDELQAIKREIGFGEHYAIEIYPRDIDLVNVANIRHLWLFESPLPIGWFGGRP